MVDVNKLRSSSAAIVFGFLLSGCYDGLHPDVVTSGSASATDGMAGETTGDEPGASETGQSETGGNDGPGSAEDCTDVGPRMLRRLTSAQLRNTLVTIFGDASVPDGQVLDDPVVRGFQVDASEAVIRDLGAQQVMQYAETVADWAIDGRLASTVPCEEHTEACREQVVRTLGAKFHREPLDEATVTAYANLMAGEPTFEDGARELLAALIQSPYFLYRRELGTADPDTGRFRLTDYELASNLSYSLTAGPPDAQLLEAAADGRLHDVEELLAQAERLIQTPPGQQNLASFVEGWLEVDDLQSRVKDEVNGVVLDELLRDDMLLETALLFQNVYAEGGGVGELLNADYTFVNQRLGHFYGLWEANGEQHARVDFPENGPPVRAPGLLGHGSVLARHASSNNSSPVARGVMVRRRLLCADLPDPPPGVDTNLEDIPDGATNRERYDAHRENPTCAACHELIDPIGFTFEHYDHVGRWRDTESNQPVDASGELSGLGSEPVSLDGLPDLAAALAGTEEAQTCFAGFFAYYTYGRDSCDLDELANAAGGSEASLRDTLEAIVAAPHFRERASAE